MGDGGAYDSDMSSGRAQSVLYNKHDMLARLWLLLRFVQRFL